MRPNLTTALSYNTTAPSSGGKQYNTKCPAFQRIHPETRNHLPSRTNCFLHILLHFSSGYHNAFLRHSSTPQQVNKLLMGDCLYRELRCNSPWASLFIWAVLQNRREMAVYFWEMVIMQLCSCCTGKAVCYRIGSDCAVKGAYYSTMGRCRCSESNRLIMVVFYSGLK